jgi:hypothetical protein
MGMNFGSTLVRSMKAGPLSDTYTTAKSVLNPDDLLDLGRGFWKPGRGLKINVRGGLKNTTGNPTVQMLIRLGPTGSPVTVFDSGQIQLNATAHTLLPFTLEITLRPDKDNLGNGTLSKLVGFGTITGRMITATSGQTDSLQGDQTLTVPQTIPALGAGFDNTVANVLDFWVGFSANSSLNGIQVWDYQVTDDGVAFATLQ